MNAKLYHYFLAILFLGSYSFGLSQDLTTNQSMELWFLKTRFKVADRNGDGQLNHTELQASSRDFEYFQNPQAFQFADMNEDGALNLQELANNALNAISAQIEKDQDEINRIGQKYPYFSQAKFKYFKRLPALTEQLFSNLIWTRDNPFIVYRILNDKDWLSQHPEVLLALHTNHAWLTEHPAIAKRFYRITGLSKQAGGLSTWRAEHLAYLKNNPQKVRQIYRLNFISLQESEINTLANDSSSPTAQIVADDISAPATNTTDITNTSSKDRLAYRNSPQVRTLLDSLTWQNALLQIANDRMETQLRAMALDVQDSTFLQDEPEALRRRIRQLNIEKELAMIEEDSLLATTIRQQNQLRQLAAQLQQVQSEEQRITQIAGANQDSLARAYLRLSKDYVNIQEQLAKVTYPDLEIARLEKEKVALAQALNQAQAQHLEEMVTLRNSLQAKALMYKAQRDTIENKWKRQIQQIELLSEENKTIANAYDELVISVPDKLAAADAGNPAYKAKIQAQKEKIEDLEIQLGIKQMTMTAKDPSMLKEDLERANLTIDSLVEVNGRHLEQLELLTEENRELASNFEDMNIEQEREAEFDMLLDSLYASITSQKAEIDTLKTRLTLQKTLTRITPVTPDTEWNIAQQKIDSLLDVNQRQYQQIALLTEENKSISWAYDSFVINNQQNLTPTANKKANSTIILALKERINQLDQQKISQELRIDEMQAERIGERARRSIEKDSLLAHMDLQHEQIKTLERQLRKELFTVSETSRKDRKKQPGIGTYGQNLADERLMQQLQELEYDNQKLREQVELGVSAFSGKESDFNRQIKTYQREIQKLERKTQRMANNNPTESSQELNKLDDVIFKLDEAESKIAQLEKTNETLYKRLYASIDFIRENVSETAYLQIELGWQKMEASRQASRADTAIKSLKAATRINWADSVAIYKRALYQKDQNLRYAESNRYRTQVASNQVIDSLEHHITLLYDRINEIQAQDRVDINRIVKIENQDRTLQQNQLRLKEQQQKLNQREVMLTEKITELEQKERKYQQLREWEKQLKILEQKIKMSPSYNGELRGKQ